MGPDGVTGRNQRAVLGFADGTGDFMGMGPSPTTAMASTTAPLWNVSVSGTMPPVSSGATRSMSMM